MLEESVIKEYEETLKKFRVMRPLFGNSKYLYCWELINKIKNAKINSDKSFYINSFINSFKEL